MEPDETIATAAAASTCSSLPTDRHLDSSGTNSTLIDESKFSTIQEGKATILFPKTEEVFYNPVQEFNRDLSVAVIRQFSERHAACSHNRKKRRNESDSHLSAPPQSNRDSTASASSASLHQIRLTILEALSATGLRSVRYALEIPSINKIVANDISPEAMELIKTNVAHNKVEDLVTPNCADASVFMYQHRWSERPTFDVVDLDPYGSPARFLDPGIQAVKDGGLLCVTCTDMGVLCGNRGEAAFAKYGVMPLRGVFCHEMALRLVLACIQGHAARYKRYIIPLLSVSIDFYIRIFVQVFSNASEVRASASKLAYVYHCVGCESFYLQPVGKMIGKEKYSPGTGPPVGQKCDQCGSIFRIGGPMWKGPIHDFEFVEKVLDHVKGNKESYHTGDRIAGILTVIAEELPDAPLFYELDKMSGFLHCVTPGMLSFRSALLDLGYDVSFSHCQKQAVKTNAPPCVLWDIMRCWVKEHPIKRLNEKSPAAECLAKEPSVQANFQLRPNANPVSRQNKMLRFQENPHANWGPKSRAKKRKQTASGETVPEKRKRLQGHRTDSAKAASLKQYKCKRFMRGECTYGDDCRYSHDVNVDAETL